MLVAADPESGSYTIALNNASSAAELISDFSYLERVAVSTLVFDLTHMAAGLTRETREDYLPGGFGYQPTRPLVEVVSTIAAHVSRPEMHSAQVIALLPNPQSRVGRFLCDMRLPMLLREIGLEVRTEEPASTEMGNDDSTRQNLIPLTAIRVSATGPDFSVVVGIRRRIEGVFRQALPADMDLASCFTSIVSEAVDNAVEYGGGGIIGGLYYPRMGEVEITLANREGGFGGANPDEQLEALLDACEGTTRRRAGGGNGIAELSQLAVTCFGTLLLSNGAASLRLPPDGSVIATTEDTTLPTSGASVTIVLQLVPVDVAERTEALRAFMPELDRVLRRYAQERGIRR